MLLLHGKSKLTFMEHNKYFAPFFSHLFKISETVTSLKNAIICK